MPTAPKELQAFGALQRTLAQATMQAVASAVKTPWKEVSLDIRSNPEGTSHSMKFRVTRVSGAVISLPTPPPVTIAILEIWQLRDASFSPRWYGMKMTITSAGQCKVDFNYDPDCKQDPAFLKN